MIRSTAFVVAALALAAASSRGEVSLEVPSSFGAKGSLDGEIETYRFFAPGGTVLSLKIAALKRAPLDFTVRLYDPSDVLVDPGPTKDTGSRVQWSGVTLAPSGLYRLEVEATGAGDYSLAVKCKPPKAFETTLDLAGMTAGTLDFTADRGGIFRFTSRPGPGSAAVPTLVRVNTPGNSIALTETVKGTTHTASLGPVDLRGDFSLVVANDGATGASLVQAKVKPAKAKPAKYDLRGTALGRPGGGGTFVAAVLESSGGTVSVQDPGSDLFGAEVQVPPGSLLERVTVSIASTVAPPPPTENDQAAGPAVDLRPSGTQFLVPVTVTLPFDIAQVPANATPDDIRILIVEDDGSSTVVDPTGVDGPGGTVSVETSGFSICIPIVVAGPPRLGLDPGGDEYWFLQFEGEMIEAGSNDSRARSLRNGIGEISLFSDGTLQFSQDSHGFDWSNQTAPPMSGLAIDSGLTETVDSDSGSLTWSYSPSGQTIVLGGSPDPQPTFRVSRDGRYMAGRTDASADAFSQSLFVVRKHQGGLAAQEVAGTWNLLFLELDADSGTASGAAAGRFARGSGTIAFNGNGGCTIKVTQRQTEFDDSDGTTTQPSGSMTFQATYTVDPGTGFPTILVTLPPEGEDPGVSFRFHPGPDLAVMLGAADPPAGSAATGFVLFRQATNLSAGALDGQYLGASIGFDPQSYNPGNPNVNVGDFTAYDEGVSIRFTGGSSADASFDRHEVHRDGMEGDGVRVNNETDSFSISVTAAKTGKVTLAAGGGKVSGFASPDGRVLAAISDLADPTGSFEFYFLFRAPPEQLP